LLKYIEEFRKYVAITGFSNAKIKDIEEFFNVVRREKPSNVEIQFFDARLVATWQHLYFAVLNALTAFKNHRNISKSLAMETILYVSAQHQIRKATEKLGIKPETSEIAMLAIGEEPETVEMVLQIISNYINAQQDPTVLELSENKTALIQKTFKISNLELEAAMGKDGLEKALVDLVIERMALLATQR
jgi:tRNA threonylcarbamoyladenosine modification (KEOPS) complex Cgi121 subunit